MVPICLAFNFWSEDQIKDLNTHCFVNLNVYQADFLKTNLTKFSVIWVERGQNGMFLKPEKLQNHGNKGKGKEKKKERGEGKEEKKKKQGLHS